MERIVATEHGEAHFTAWLKLPGVGQVDGWLCCCARFGKDEYFIVRFGDPWDADNPMVRLHSGCLTGDVFRSERCDCGPQLKLAIELIEQYGSGMVVYAQHHEGRGIGLFEKMLAYELQDAGVDTFRANELLGHPVDARNFGQMTAILSALGVTSGVLLSNNPDKLNAVTDGGLSGFCARPLICEPTIHNRRYLVSKRKAGHSLGDLVSSRDEAACLRRVHISDNELSSYAPGQELNFDGATYNVLEVVGDEPSYIVLTSGLTSGTKTP